MAALRKAQPTPSAANPASPALALGDFVLVKGPKKNLLVEVTQSRNGEYEGVDASTLDGDSISFATTDVLAYLPPDFDPAATAFGVKLEAVRVVENGPLGPVPFFVSMPQEDRKVFMDSLTACVEWLQEEGLLADKEVHVSFRAPHGKWAGSYKYSSKASKPDQLRLHTALTPEAFDYVVSHEFGHHVWYNLVSDDFKAQWVALYTDSVDVASSDAKDLDACLQAFEACDGDHKAAAAECGNKVLYSEILKVIKKVWRIRPQVLTAFARAGLWDRVQEVWPQDTISLGEPEELLSAYAKVSPEELFAEAFSDYYLRRQLPPAIDDLMTKTLAAASQRKATPAAAKPSRAKRPQAA